MNLKFVKMDGLLNPNTWKIENTADLLQQIGLLSYLKDDNKEFLQNITQMRVATEVFRRVSSQQEVDQLQQLVILGIVDYINKHPRATENELAAEIGRQVQAFKEAVDKL